jgi:hypothetical protein
MGKRFFFLAMMDHLQTFYTLFPSKSAREDGQKRAVGFSVHRPFAP